MKDTEIGSRPQAWPDACVWPTVTLAEGSTHPAAGARGDTVLSQVEVTATVTKIDHKNKTREVAARPHHG